MSANSDEVHLELPSPSESPSPSPSSSHSSSPSPIRPPSPNPVGSRTTVATDISSTNDSCCNTEEINNRLNNHHMPLGKSPSLLSNYEHCPDAVNVTSAFKSYGSGKSVQPVLRNLNMVVKSGTIYGLLGASGCGKTTLLSCILGLRSLDGGVINVLGRIPGSKGAGVPGRRVGYMPQAIALLPDFNIKEILYFFGKIHGMPSSHIKEKAEFLINFLELPSPDQFIRNLSGGQQRRVSFAVALLHDPELLLLDEPTVGMDPLLRQSIWAYLVEITSAGRQTVIITTHYIEETRQAHMVGLMRGGRLLAEGTPEALLNRHGLETLEEVFLHLCVSDQDTLDRNELKRRNSQLMINIANNQDTVVGLAFNQSKDALVSMGAKNNSQLSRMHGVPMSALDPPSYFSSCVPAINRLTALIQKNFRRIWRNVNYVLFIVALPVLLTVIFCLAVGRDPKNLKVAVINHEYPLDPICKPYYECAFVNLSCAFLQEIDKEVVNLIPYPDEVSAERAVSDGEAWGMIVLPVTFSDEIVNRYSAGFDATNATIEGSVIDLRLDMSNQNIGYNLQRVVLEAFRNFSRNTLSYCELNPDIGDIPIKFGEPIHGERYPQFMEFMAPGVIISIIYCFSMALMLLVFVLERREGMAERLKASGVRPGEIVTGYIVSQYLLMVAQIACVLPFTFLVFKVPAKGPIEWVIALLLLHGTSGMTLGILISAVTVEEMAAVHVGICICFQLLILSGTVWPLEGMPTYLRYMSYALPTTLATESLRSMLLRGWGLLHWAVWPGFVAGVVWIVFDLVALAFVITCSQQLL